MKNLDRWVAAYVAMDDEARADHLTFAESSALAHPARKLTSLYLAASGSGLGAREHSLKVSDGIAPPALVK